MVLWLGYFFPLIFFWFDLECKITVARVHYDIAESCMIPCQVFFYSYQEYEQLGRKKTCIVEGGKKIPHKDVSILPGSRCLLLQKNALVKA